MPNKPSYCSLILHAHDMSERKTFFFLFYDDHELWVTYNVRSFSVGLAWTAMGGEIMFVEATRMGGEGKITLTGQLGGSITSWLFLVISNRTGKENSLVRS